MAKRFTDTEKFNDVWYRKLPLLQKVIWEYLLAECNHAGIFENFDLEMMSFKIGETVTTEDLEFFKDRIVFLNSETIFIPKFIDFQYGKLNPVVKVHASVIKELEKHSIDSVNIEYSYPMDRVSKDYNKTIDSIKDKNNNKDIYKDKINNKVINNNPDNLFNPIVKEFQKQMKSVLHNAIRLSIEQSNKVVELNQRIPDFEQTIPIVFERLKHIQWNFDGHFDNPDVNWLLKDENYISVLNGRYTTKQQIIAEKLRQKEAENGGG